MTAQEERRASGRTTAEEITKEVSATADDPVEPQEPGERDIQFDSPGFHRIRTDWRSGEYQIIQQVQRKIDKVIYESFWQAFSILDELHSIVRDAVIDPASGEQKIDSNGNPVWARDGRSGLPVEDWSRLTDGDRRNALYQIMNLLVGWEQRAEEMRGDALFAKAKWEEMFAQGFESMPPGKGRLPTVEDREARAKMVAADERYFAVFVNALSRRSDALVKSMVRIHDDFQRSLPYR